MYMYPLGNKRIKGEISMFKFENSTEARFYDYLLSRGYAKSTAADYIRRLRKIKSLDLLVNENLDALIADYESGANANANARSHKAYSCALKRLKESI